MVSELRLEALLPSYSRFVPFFAKRAKRPGGRGGSEEDTLWCLIEDTRLVFGTTWIFPGVLVLQSCFSVKRLACLVIHPGFQLFLLALLHDDVIVTSNEGTPCLLIHPGL